MGEVTRAIVDFAVSADFDALPDSVPERVAVHMVDSLGVALAGTASPAVKVLGTYLRGQGFGNCGVTVVGSQMRAPPRFAALVNGTSIHADNFDDTSPQILPERTGGIHTSAAILPVVLALGEALDSSGKRLITAYSVGCEVASRLNHAMAPRHYAGGFHTTGTLNLFGAVTAAGVMLRLDPETLRNAIGLAASLSSGVRRNFGTMTEIMHAGLAAEQGIVAADLAKSGMTAAPDALDGTAGYVDAAAGSCDTGAIINKLGAPWVFETPGVWIKPYPNGSLTHPAADCLIRLLESARVSAEDIRQIRVRTNRRILNTLLQDLPSTVGQARFSMPFALAVCAVRGRLGLAEFTEATLMCPRIVDMMARVEHCAFDQEEEDFTNVTSFVEVVLASGQQLEGRSDHAPGSSARPFSFDEVSRKFTQCAVHGGYSQENAAKILPLTRKLRQLDRLDVLWSALSLPNPGHTGTNPKFRVDR